jgi:2-dehydropantoate 2-reductase
MNISILGPGAMGCLYGAKLSNAGASVTLVDYKPDRAARLADSGVTLDTDSGSLSTNPAVSLTIPKKQDLIIVLTKAHTTPQLKLPTGTPVLTLQNGLGNIEALCDLVGSANVIAGTTTEAATLTDEGRVRHTGNGITQVGGWTSCPTEGVTQILTKAGLAAEATTSPGQAVWEKTVINAGINPLTALMGVRNGKLLELPQARQLLRDLVVEAAKIASTEGYRFSYSLVEKAEQVCEDTAENISSMLQDVRAGRRTEIDAISGEILRRSERSSLPVPRTRVVWQLVKSIEQR